MEHCYLDDIAKNALNYLSENYPTAVQKTSLVPIVNHVRNCQGVLTQCGWLDHFHWHPMLELCRLEPLEEEVVWQKLVPPYQDMEHAQSLRLNFGRFFRRCNYLAKADSFQCQETFYWLTGCWQNEVWGILMADALAVSDELLAAGKTAEAADCLRHSAPLYVMQSLFASHQIPPGQEPPSGDWKKAEEILALEKEEQETIRLWDDLYSFDQKCTISLKSAWLKRWKKLGGTQFWESI